MGKVGRQINFCFCLRCQKENRDQHQEEDPVILHVYIIKKQGGYPMDPSLLTSTITMIYYYFLRILLECISPELSTTERIYMPVDNSEISMLS